jgi:hypothetical protein
MKETIQFKTYWIVTMLFIFLAQINCAGRMFGGRVIEDFPKKAPGLVHWIYLGWGDPESDEHKWDLLFGNQIRFNPKDTGITMLMYPFLYDAQPDGWAHLGVYLDFFDGQGKNIKPPGVSQENVGCIFAKIIQYTLAAFVTKEEIEQKFGQPLLTFISDECSGGEVLFYFDASIWEGYLVCVNNNGNATGFIRLKSIIRDTHFPEKEIIKSTSLEAKDVKVSWQPFR